MILLIERFELFDDTSGLIFNNGIVKTISSSVCLICQSLCSFVYIVFSLLNRIRLHITLANGSHYDQAAMIILHSYPSCLRTVVALSQYKGGVCDE